MFVVGPNVCGQKPNAKCDPQKLTFLIKAFFLQTFMP